MFGLRRTAKLPEHLIESNTIANMQPGDSGWTVPWAMAVDQDADCYLNGDYTLRDRPGGTSEMRVTRTRDGYIVDAPKGYRWQPSNGIPWVGADNDDLVPVIQIR